MAKRAAIKKRHVEPLDSNAPFGEKLRDWREDDAIFTKTHTLTQLQVAGHLGVSDSLVSNWETGQSFPDPDQIREMSGLYGVKYAEMVRAAIFNEFVRYDDYPQSECSFFSDCKQAQVVSETFFGGASIPQYRFSLDIGHCHATSSS